MSSQRISRTAVLRLSRCPPRACRGRVEHGRLRPKSDSESVAAGSTDSARRCASANMGGARPEVAVAAASGNHARDWAEPSGDGRLS